MPTLTLSGVGVGGLGWVTLRWVGLGWGWVGVGVGDPLALGWGQVGVLWGLLPPLIITVSVSPRCHHGLQQMRHMVCILGDCIHLRMRSWQASEVEVGEGKSRWRVWGEQIKHLDQKLNT